MHIHPWIFNKYPIYSHDGARTKFSTSWDETDYSVDGRRTKANIDLQKSCVYKRECNFNMTTKIIILSILERSKEVWAGLGMSRTRENSVSGSPTSAEQVSFLSVLWQYYSVVWRRSKFINSWRACAPSPRKGCWMLHFTYVSFIYFSNYKNDGSWLYDTPRYQMNDFCWC